MVEAAVAAAVALLDSLRKLPRKTVGYGTGSCPPLQNGLQRRMRHAPSKDPFIAPCFPIASTAYLEHDGVNRHDGGNNGETNR